MPQLKTAKPAGPESTVCYFTCFKGCFNGITYMSQLWAGRPVIPSYFCAGWSQIRLVYASGHYGDSVRYGDEYYFYLMGGHTLTSPKGGGPCPLSTLNYGVVGHLAF